MARIITKLQVIALLAFAYGLNYLAITPDAARADAPTEFKLSEDNYHWMLGHEFSAFNAAFELARTYQTTPGLGAATDAEIRSVFRVHAPERSVLAIRRYTTKANTTPNTTAARQSDNSYDGWIVWLDNGTVVGIKNSVYQDHTTGNPEIVLGLADDNDPETWFAHSWYERDNLKPFRAEFATANLDERKFSLPGLRVSGAHYDANVVVEDFSRLNPALGLEWQSHNPRYVHVAGSKYGRDQHHNSRALVAVLDGGVDYNNPTLQPKLARAPDNGHRAFVANETKGIDSKLKLLNYLPSYLALISQNETASLERRRYALQMVFQYGAHGFDFVDGDNRPYDDTGAVNPTTGLSRASMIASIAAGDGVATAALPIRISGASTNDFNESQGDRFEDAVTFAEAYGARIVAVGSSHYLMSDSVAAAAYRSMGARDSKVNAAVKANKADRGNFAQIVDVMKAHPKILFVLAAGNEDPNGLIGHRDADEDYAIKQGNASVHLPNVLVVAALDSQGGLASSSVYGRHSVQLAAPGYLPGVPGGMTDYAAPYIAHAAAWLLSRSPKLTVEDIITDLRTSVLPAPSLKATTAWGGYLNFDSLREKFGG